MRLNANRITTAATAALDITRQPCVFVPATEAENWRGLERVEIVIVNVVTVAPDRIDCVIDGEPHALTTPPLLCLGLFAADATGVAMLELVRDWLVAKGTAGVPQPALVPRSDKALALRDIIAGATTLFIDQARLLTALTRELAALRHSYARTQKQFASLEAATARLGLQPVELAFSDEPTAATATSPEALGTAAFTQILPVASLGVVAIGIHVASSSRRSTAVCRISLESIEDEIALASWELRASELEEGWNAFGLDKAVAGLRRTLRLTIAIAGGDGLPRISLGGAQPIAMFQLSDAASGAPLAQRNLAVRIWTGLPGVSPPGTLRLVMPSRHGSPRAGFEEIGLLATLAQATMTIDAGEHRFDFDAVATLVAENALACHPPPAGITIARFAGACPPDALRVSAQAAIDNEAAKDVEFAIAVCDAGADPRELFAASDAAPRDGFSGWLRASPAAAAPIHLFLASQGGAPRDLCFATRMAVAGSNEFAWAKFKSVGALVSRLAAARAP